jgi:uncharacterized protein (TIGR03118 family)
MFRNNDFIRLGRLCARTTLPLLAILIAACGGGNGGYGNMASPMAPAAPMAPTITLSAQPTTITLGQSVDLTWSATNANTCSASGSWSGSENGSGKQSVTPTTSGTATYTLACTAPTGPSYSGGGGGSTTQSATVTVNSATAYVSKTLVGDSAGTGMTTDAKLVNPWGIVFGKGAPVWIANNGTQTSTLYDGNGVPEPATGALVVTLPPDPSGKGFNPTGIVFNGSTDFVVSAGGKQAASLFIYSGESGGIAGWAPSVAPTAAIVAYTDSGGAVYKGLTIAKNGSSNFLYASDFHNNKIDVFNAAFAKQPATATSFQFVDPNLPAGYAPFGIQAIPNGTGGATQIYVTYAQQAGADNANGPGLGLVDVYDANGKFLQHLVPVGGALNAPWGVALAPTDFGTLSGAVLVGNFGDGKVNGYDASSGRFLGSITDRTGAAFAVAGLWGIAFGNDALSQPHNTLFFTAGTNHEVNGVYGRIDMAQ